MGVDLVIALVPAVGLAIAGQPLGLTSLGLYAWQAIVEHSRNVPLSRKGEERTAAAAAHSAFSPSIE